MKNQLTDCENIRACFAELSCRALRRDLHRRNNSRFGEGISPTHEEALREVKFDIRESENAEARFHHDASAVQLMMGNCLSLTLTSTSWCIGIVRLVLCNGVCENTIYWLSRGASFVRKKRKESSGTKRRRKGRLSK